MRPADRRMAAPSWWENIDVEHTPFKWIIFRAKAYRFSTSMLVYPEVMYVYIQLYVYIYIYKYNTVIHIMHDTYN